MDILAIKVTPKTPSISFDAKKGKLEIKGRSFPEVAIEFYRPLIESLEQYSQHPNQLTEVDVQLEYFTTASSKCLYMAFKILESIQKKGKRVIVNWYYEEGDDLMIEEAERFRHIIKVDFNTKQVLPE
ncbi:MAG: DUF1987 domain-containing protein [Bacteroidia bacterium]